MEKKKEFNFVFFFSSFFLKKMDLEGLLRTRKPKLIRRELIRQDTRDADILLYYIFNEYRGNCILALFDNHFNDCECRQPFNNMFQTMKCSRFLKFYTDYKTFKGFWYYLQFIDRQECQEKAIYELSNQTILKFLTYLPLYVLTQDYAYLEKSVNAGIPQAYYEMYLLTKDIEYLKYSAKFDVKNAQRTLAALYDQHSYYYLKYSRVLINDPNETSLYFKGKFRYDVIPGDCIYEDFYKKCHDNCKNAVMTWLLIYKELYICKDIALIIAKKLWKTRHRNAKDWGFVIQGEGWFSWIIKKLF